jgi:hypothetical protein
MTNIILTQLVLATIGPKGLPGRVKNNYSLEQLKHKVAKKQKKPIKELNQNLELLCGLANEIIKRGKKRNMSNMSEDVKDKVLKLKARNPSRREEYMELYRTQGDSNGLHKQEIHHPYKTEQMLGKEKTENTEGNVKEVCNSGIHPNRNKIRERLNGAKNWSTADLKLVSTSVGNVNERSYEQWFRMQRSSNLALDEKFTNNNELNDTTLGKKQEHALESLSQDIKHNNHHSWEPHKEIFKEVMIKEKTHRDLVKFVAEQWGSTHDEDRTTQNLSEVNFTGRMEQMLFETTLKEKLQNCAALTKDELFKKDFEGGQGKVGINEIVVTKKKYIDLVLISANIEMWTPEKSAEVIFGVEETFDLHASFNSRNPFISLESVSELISMEKVHDITKMYPSPYRINNQDDPISGTWTKQLLEDY